MLREHVGLKRLLQPYRLHFSLTDTNPGRCPGLSHFSPLGLNHIEPELSSIIWTSDKKWKTEPEKNFCLFLSFFPKKLLNERKCNYIVFGCGKLLLIYYHLQQVVDQRADNWGIILFDSIAQYLKKDVWQVNVSDLPTWQRYWVKLVRVILLTTQGFTSSQIQQGSSSLTYYSLLALVPIIALLIALARAFYFQQTLESWLLQHFYDQASVIKQVFKYADAALKEARGGIIAGVGLAILLWSAINILSSIEFVMNQIWEVHRSRSLAKMFTDYLAVLFLAPILVFLATGLTGYISALLSAFSRGTLLEHFAIIMSYVFTLVSFLLLSMAFVFLYIFMPNTRVKFLPALIAGIFTGVIYQLLQWVYFYFQIGVTSYNAVYGTFAALPLFLVWLHLSWIIILTGAKLAFAIQNVDAYAFLGDTKISNQTRLLCSLRIAQLCVQRFDKGAAPLTLIEICNKLSIPRALTSQLIFQLVASNVLSEIKRDDQDEVYQPASSLDKLTLKRTIDKINGFGESIIFPQSPELESLTLNLAKLDASIEKSEGNVLLRDT